MHIVNTKNLFSIIRKTGIGIKFAKNFKIREKIYILHPRNNLKQIYQIMIIKANKSISQVANILCHFIVGYLFFSFNTAKVLARSLLLLK